MRKTSDSSHSASASSTRGWLHEPLLHFLLIGAALFAVYAYQQKGRGPAPARQITLTSDHIRQLAAYFESEQHRQPTADELQLLVQNKVQEEILYREALGLGLDKDDAIVKSRLAEKMRFLVEGETAVEEPTPEELRAWFEKHASEFAIPERVSFRHIYFSNDKRGGSAKVDAESTLNKLASEPKNSILAASQGDEFMFQGYYGEWSTDELAKDFGAKFGVEAMKLNQGSWQGPVESDHGWHLVFVDAKKPARAPAFEEVAAEVQVAWLEEQSREAWHKAYEAMRATYSVTLPAATDAAGNSSQPTPAQGTPAKPAGESQ